MYTTSLTYFVSFSDYAFYEYGHPPSRLLAALRILFLPQFNQRSASTLHTIQQWQHLLYATFDDEPTTSYPVSNQFLQYFIHELCQHAVEQTQIRIDQLVSYYRMVIALLSLLYSWYLTLNRHCYIQNYP
jgi:hypothetical protein